VFTFCNLDDRILVYHDGELICSQTVIMPCDVTKTFMHDNCCYWKLGTAVVGIACIKQCTADMKTCTLTVVKVI